MGFCKPILRFQAIKDCFGGRLGQVLLFSGTWQQTTKIHDVANCTKKQSLENELSGVVFCRI